MPHLVDDYNRYQRFRFRRSACWLGNVTGWLAAESCGGRVPPGSLCHVAFPTDPKHAVLGEGEIAGPVVRPHPAPLRWLLWPFPPILLQPWRFVREGSSLRDEKTTTQCRCVKSIGKTEQKKKKNKKSDYEARHWNGILYSVLRN